MLRAVEEMWDPRKLHKEIKRKYGDPDGGHVAKHKLPPTLSAQIRQIRDISQTWLAKRNDVWAGARCERRATGKIEAVGDSANGFPLGIESDTTYGQHSIQLAPGESLTLFTDGIIDAMNAANERYTEDRLRAQLEQPDTEALRVRQRLLDDLRHFVGNEPQTDGMCMTYLRRIA